jgi:glycerol-3-phosphate acyltransferase PlsX
VTLPIAVDAMGGDEAPAEIVAGAVQAARELAVPVVLVGPPDLADTVDTGGLGLIPASEVIGMDEDPAASVRRKKDSSLVRAAEAVRDGKAAAMVSAGNTGATMASALLRMGRVKGVQRPAIAIAVPVPGSTPTLLLDAGANAECVPAWLVQFAQMGSVFAAERFGLARPRVGLLSIGEEPTKGTPLVKETHALLAAGAAGPGVHFVGNVEGRDVMTDQVDVVVTDGFTGNVVLKSLEGSLKCLADAVFLALEATEETRAAAPAVRPGLLALADDLDPESHGGAILLGVDGVCVISHGSSSARAIVNAVRVARDMARADVVGRLREAVAAGGPDEVPTA